MKILFINQAGGGFAGEKEIADGTRIDDFIYSEIGEEAELGDHKIRVNGQMVPRTTILADGDQITCTSQNMKGATNN